MHRNILALVITTIGVSLGCSRQEADQHPGARLSTESVSRSNRSDAQSVPLGDERTVVVRGTLPVVLVATHDGDLPLSGVPRRENHRHLAKFSVARDRYTAPLLREISKAIEQQTGRRPYVVINRISRKVMDANRPPESAFEHAGGEKAYRRFHETLADVLADARSLSPDVLLVDVHGQTKHPADVCLGTHDGLTLRHLSRADGNWPMVEMSRELVAAGFSVPGFVHQVRTDWIGKKREPTPRVITIPASLPVSMQRGGWLIRHYAANEPGVAAIQIEVHRRVRYQRDVRIRFANAFARALATFVDRYLAVVPGSADRPHTPSGDDES